LECRLNVDSERLMMGDSNLVARLGVP
jgi:hypothetical protein